VSQYEDEILGRSLGFGAALDTGDKEYKVGNSRYTQQHTDKKEIKSFLIYKEFQNGAVAKPYMTNGLPFLIL
jgi:hypothetical protein